MEISTEKRPELFAALSKMQGELTAAFKAKSGHGYNYADLAQCIKTAQESLKNNGLSVIQLLNETERGTELETVLTHEAGGYISSSFLMAKAVLAGGGAKNPAQTMGSSITYMRRYAYSAIIGMAQTDDDACDVVAPPITDRGVDEIKGAVLNNDHQYVKDNWSKIIKDKWQKLDSKTIENLNLLLNQKDK
jgi:hypothetical protein